MVPWMGLIAVAVAGATGGFINALLTDNGFAFWKSEETADDGRIVRPGFLGNVLIGAFSAIVPWGLYGPFASSVIIGQPPMDAPSTSVTLASLVGAVFVGIGGSRWLSNEVDKKLLRETVTTLTTAPPAQPQQAVAIATAQPAEALHLARELGR